MTGKMGLVRNLTAGEILAQVLFARRAVRLHKMVSLSVLDTVLPQLVEHGPDGTKKDSYAHRVVLFACNRDSSPA